MKKGKGKLEPFKNEIIKKYKSGMSAFAIAGIFNCDHSSIIHLLHRENIPKRPFKKDLYKEIIKLYLNGNSSTIIAKNFNISVPYVIEILKKNNIKRKTASDAARIFSINNSFFEKIDTNEKAYFLGLLYADGYNNTDKGNFCIKLKYYDKEILEKLKNIIEYTGPLRKERNGDMIGLMIQCRKISNDLNKLGCVKKKSLILTFPSEDLLPKEFQKSFILGYWDGDGCLSIKNSAMRWSMVGTKEFCLKVKEIIENNLNINMGLYITNPNRNKITHTLTIGGNFKTKKVMEYLYENESIFLKRKNDLFNVGVSNIPDIFKLEKYKNEIISKYEDKISIKKIAKIYNVCPMTVRNLLSKETGKTKFNNCIKLEKKVECNICKSINTCSKGTRPDGFQRIYCKVCKKSFTIK